MNLIIKYLTLIIVVNTTIIFANQAAAEDEVSFQVFYDELNPYGQWVNDPNYGYIWIPDVGPDFVPYSTAGHWVYTDYGWTWVSDYEWGWGPFHYGRWDYNDDYGWFWVPGYEWGPAWVVWRRSEGYFGWTPIRPGVSIDIVFRNEYEVPHERWIFVRDRDIERPDIDRCYINRNENITIINKTTVINNTYVDNNRHTTYIAGPSREAVQRVTGRTIRPVVVEERNKPGQNLRNDRLQIYRPLIRRNNDQNLKPAPPRVVSPNEVRRPSNEGAIRQPEQNREKEQPAQRITNPSENRREEQPNKENPQNINNKEQPSHQKITNPSEDDRKENQPHNVNGPKPVEQPKAYPSNKRRGQQKHVQAPKSNRNEEQSSEKKEREEKKSTN